MTAPDTIRAAERGERRDYSGVPDVGSLPTVYADDTNLAPEKLSADGRPWSKCCGECAFRDGSVRRTIEASCAEAGAAFYCVHREDDTGHYRVCAGFPARDRLTTTPVRTSAARETENGKSYG